MTPPGATRALLLRHIKALAAGGTVIELRGREVAAALGLSVFTVKHVMLALVHDGTLLRLHRGTNVGPSVYQLAPPKVAPKPKPLRVRVPVPERLLNVQQAPEQRRTPALVTLAPAPRADNPVRLVAPGTYAVRGFTMLRRDAR